MPAYLRGGGDLALDSLHFLIIAFSLCCAERRAHAINPLAQRRVRRVILQHFEKPCRVFAGAAAGLRLSLKRSAQLCWALVAAGRHKGEHRAKAKAA